MTASLLTLPPALADSAPLIVRGIGFAVFAGYYTRGIVPLTGLMAFVAALVLFTLPASSAVSLTDILSSGPNGVASSAVATPLALVFQFSIGSVLGLIAGVFIFAARLLAAWSCAAIEPQEDEIDSPRHTQALETAIVLLSLVSLSPLLPQFFGHFAESFALFPLKTAGVAFGPLFAKAAISVGTMAFSAALLFALPVIAVCLALQVSFFLLQKLFPAMLSPGFMRAAIAPVLLAVVAQGMYRFSLYCNESQQELLTRSALEQLKDIKSASTNGQ